jgi:hypothetical protein
MVMRKKTANDKFKTELDFDKIAEVTAERNVNIHISNETATKAIYLSDDLSSALENLRSLSGLLVKRKYDDKIFLVVKHFQPIKNEDKFSIYEVTVSIFEATVEKITEESGRICEIRSLDSEIKLLDENLSSSEVIASIVEYPDDQEKIFFEIVQNFSSEMNEKFTEDDEILCKNFQETTSLKDIIECYSGDRPEELLILKAKFLREIHGQIEEIYSSKRLQEWRMMLEEEISSKIYYKK